MINTPVLPTLTIVPLHAATLDDRARQWVRDLDLKGRNLSYLCHSDFEVGYHFGFGQCQDELADGNIPTLEDVINEIEFSLSHAIYERHSRSSQALGRSYVSYTYQVGALFGWLTALLQTDVAQDFPFLLAPIADMHSYRASRVPLAGNRSYCPSRASRVPSCF